LIYYSLSGPQPVAGGTCIPLMQYYLQNVVKSWCTALKSPLLSCITDPLNENTSLFSAWYTTDSEDVSVFICELSAPISSPAAQGKGGQSSPFHLSWVTIPSTRHEVYFTCLFINYWNSEKFNLKLSNFVF
jgi:hypothetical protein